MAIIQCKECGKEISNKAEACPHCGCPVDQENHKDKIFEIIRKNRKAIIIFAVVVFAIILGCTIYKASTKNAFSPYLELMGKSYKEIPDNYEVLNVMDTMKVAEVDTELIFGLPGTMQYTYMYDDETGEFGNVEIISWITRKEDNLTEKQVETFVSGMKDAYGKWDSKTFSEAEYDFSSDQDVYTWKNKKGYNIFLRVDTDMGGIHVTWHDDDTEYVSTDED